MGTIANLLGQLGARGPCIPHRRQPSLVTRFENLWACAVRPCQWQDYCACMAAVEDGVGAEYYAPSRIGLDLCVRY